MTPFGVRAPLCGVIHLPPSIGCHGCPGMAVARAALSRDLGAIAGVDAVLLENDDDKPHALVVSRPQLAWITRLAADARAQVKVPLGINVQRIDWEGALAIAAAAELDFVRLDVFVDRVRMEDEIVELDAAAIRARRDQLAPHALLFTDVHVKHADLLSAEPIGASALRAARAGSDALLVTGARTGEPPSPADLDEARAAGVAVLIGSGLTSDNAAALAPHADGALVGTALKQGGRVDAARVAAMLASWRAATAGAG